MTDTEHKTPSFGEMTVSEFIEKIASNEPVPGGGSVAAFAGAVAAGLGEMVANLTVGKKGYETVEGEMKQLVEKAQPLRRKLTQDIDNDSDAYNRVFSAFKLPKTTEEEKQKRQDAIQAGLKHAASVPMGVAEDALKLLELARTAVETGNRNAVSDAAVGVMMARTAVLSALYNVKINLDAIKDEAFVEVMAKKVRHLEADAVRLEAEMLALVDL
jgi:formiminotetrahydrofolate cyclodeaminase